MNKAKIGRPRNAGGKHVRTHVYIARTLYEELHEAGEGSCTRGLVAKMQRLKELEARLRRPRPRPPPIPDEPVWTG
jgi:hypothetical protein